MSKNRFVMIFMCIMVGAMVFLVQPAMAARAVYINVNPDVNEFDINGPNAVHTYTVPDGGSINDRLPLQICMTNYETSSPNHWNSIVISFGSTGGNLRGVTLPLDQTFSYGTAIPDCRDLEITVKAGPFYYEDGNNYIATFNMSEPNSGNNPATGANKPHATYEDVKNFKILVDVLQPEVSNVSCFLTDSEGMFLTDCKGVWVTDSGSDDGRFAIVANKKGIGVSTNPGQFYFNFVWYNSTKSEQTVDVNFDRLGVIPKGANAIHSALFSGDLSTVNPPIFDETNMDGIPDGSDDQASGIVVPAGYSLLVTYHLEWAHKGQKIPADIALSCEKANQVFAVHGTVSGSGIQTESCTSSALGYKK